ncbi:MAG TPA: SigE family RNA polymerase sigma factor [Actinomycetales bacterium]|nr:SigE family RNA polymerase sigma factor [Actinomycetales bacterium]
MAADQQAQMTAFVAGHRTSLFRTAFLLVGDHHEAEELLQETLVRVVAAWSRIERRDAPEVYARRAMVNLATNRWRRRATVNAYLRREQRPESVQDPAGEVVDRDALWTALSTLPVRMRAVLVLRYFEDQSERQTADILGCSVGTVKSQTSKALSRLRDRLEAHELTVTPPDETACVGIQRSQS